MHRHSGSWNIPVLPIYVERGRERDARYVDMAAIDACRSVDEVVPGAATPSAGILCIHPEPSATGR